MIGAVSPPDPRAGAPPVDKIPADEKKRLLDELARIRTRVEALPDFDHSLALGALRVCLATVEGAIAFDDLPELADVCAAFAEKTARDVTERG
jgi:hypothetical protein